MDIVSTLEVLSTEGKGAWKGLKVRNATFSGSMRLMRKFHRQNQIRTRVFFILFEIRVRIQLAFFYLFEYQSLIQLRQPTTPTDRETTIGLGLMS